jgi:Cu2+-exporting ATPase
VLAGSLNRESPLLVRVTEAGRATTLASLARMVERAADARPRTVALAERVGAHFVAGLLVVAAASALYWWHEDPSKALAVAFAVLVVSCPCALSLATPAALAVSAGALGRRGIVAVRPDAIEALARATHVVFDKTGTLTAGTPRVAAVDVEGRLDAAACRATASALEAGASHPIAAALRRDAIACDEAAEIVASPGDGVAGVVGGRAYRLGRPAWVGTDEGDPSPDATVVALADDAGWLARFTLVDALRPGAARVVAQLRQLGLAVTLLSGDSPRAVERIAAAAGIADAHGDARPDDKRAFVAARQREGAVVAMVGDGINDAPGARAGRRVDRARPGLGARAVDRGHRRARRRRRLRRRAFAAARRTFAVIRQNFGWAIAYNAIAIPLAATGAISPLAASAGMSLSSLVVVANALRLARR